MPFMHMLAAAVMLAASNRTCIVTDGSDAPAGQAAGVTLRHCVEVAYSTPCGATAITFNIRPDANESGLPAYATVALGGTPLNLSAPVSASHPVTITIDGTTQPEDALDPHRHDPTTTPKVTIRPANRSAAAAAFVLGDGGPGSVSGAVTLRGLSVAGFGDPTAGAIGGGVAAVQLWPSLTIEAGCAFQNNLPAAVSVVGTEGAPAGAVVIQHATVFQPPASVGTGVSVGAAFSGSLSLVPWLGTL